MPPRSSTYGRADDQRLHAFRYAFADRVELPMSASVLDEAVTVIEIAYGIRFLLPAVGDGRPWEHSAS